MKKAAFIKFAGLAAGGTEKYLQTIACLLPKDKFQIDYFYTNAAPFLNSGFVHPDNDNMREQIVRDAGVNIVPVHVDSKNGEPPPYNWNGTDFWDKFRESEYDFVQTARGGYPEYPFNIINHCPIIDSIHSFRGEDKPNIKNAILLCNWQAQKWASNGGNINKAVIIPSIVPVPPKKPSTLRARLGLGDDIFIYGFHQANRSDIFSGNSLIAYAAIENRYSAFVILGGCQQHRDLARQLNLQNVFFIDFASSVDDIHDFLGGINAYAHARSDGEVCSAAIIEAMYHGKPVISHPALNMGHAEQLEGCGVMANSLDDYVTEMKMLQIPDYYITKSEKTLKRYEDRYNYRKVEQDMVSFYENLQL